MITSTIPMKSPLFATTKNVNYLPNVLSVMEAEEKGAFASIWVDEEGYIAEGPNVNVAFITHDKELILPFFDKILSGCTAKRLLELAPKLVEQGRLKDVRTANVTVEEAKGSAEMMYVGSTLPLLPIVMWDEKPIGDGMQLSSFPHIFDEHSLLRHSETEKSVFCMVQNKGLGTPSSLHQRSAPLIWGFHIFPHWCLIEMEKLLAFV